MDPRWLPWCWAAGAVGCAVVFWAVQPWRGPWAHGWRMVRHYPATWLIPSGLALADAIFARLQGVIASPPYHPVSAVAQSLAEAWQGIHLGSGAALIGSFMLAVNAWGIRRGFMKGITSVTGETGKRWVAVLLVGAVALGADAGLAGREVPAVWHGAATALAIPLVGWVAATVLAGLLLLGETAGRAPEKMEGVRWLESAAAHSIRLWPWALGHGFLWWLGRVVPAVVGFYGGVLLALVALTLAFAPLIFLHVKNLTGARAGAGEAVRGWRTKAWQPCAWLGAAGILFTGWAVTGEALYQSISGLPAWTRIGLASAHRLVHMSLTVMALVAWVGFRLADAPPTRQPRRSRR